MKYALTLLLTAALIVPAFARQPALSASTRVVYASSVAVLDSNISSGGGTDDTAALQAVLDTAPTVGHLVLIMDGVALVSGLNVRSNTTIVGLNGGGFYLKNGSNRAIIRNLNRSAGAITDNNITLRNLAINGNRSNQSKCADGTNGILGYCLGGMSGAGYVMGVEFFGVRNLRIEGVHIYYNRNISFHVGNVVGFNFHNNWAEQPDYLMDNYGGLQVQGKSYGVSINNFRCTKTTDDCIALNAFDPTNIFGPFVSNGPISDVTINGLHLDNAFFGLRMSSDVAANNIDQVFAYNIHGTVQDNALRLNSGWEYGGAGAGGFRVIVVNSIKVRHFTGGPPHGYGELVRIEAAVDDLTVLNVRQGHGWSTEYRPIFRFMPARSQGPPIWCDPCSGGLADVKTFRTSIHVTDPPGTDPTGGGSPNAGYRIMVEGNIGRAFVDITHERDASVNQPMGAVWVRAANSSIGIGELHLTGSVNRQLNTVAITGGKINRMFVNGFSDVDNAGNFLQINDSGGGVAGPVLRVSNLHLNAGALVGGAQANSASLAGVISGVGVTFASLGASANGTQVYCSDCTKTTPCAAGGTGAVAKRLNGSWDCN